MKATALLAAALPLLLLSGCVERQDVEVSLVNRTGVDGAFTVTFEDGGRAYERTVEVADGSDVAFTLPDMVVQTYTITVTGPGYEQATRADVGGVEPAWIQLTAEPDRLRVDSVSA